MWNKAVGIALTLMLLLTACAETRMLALNVGKADAILVDVDGHTALIDAGHVSAYGRICAGMKALGAESLDWVILTHTDGDHADGMAALSGMEVGAWAASAYYTCKEKKHPFNRLGVDTQWLRAGDAIALGSARLSVLAPDAASDNEDDNSLVMMLESADGRILLGGDMESAEEAALLDSGAALNCDILKVPNHADDDTCSEAFLRACAPKLAVISTDSFEKPGTPDMRILAALEMIGARTAVTQDYTLGVLCALEGGAVGVQDVVLEPTDGVTLETVSREEDRVTLRSAADAPVDLTGWMLTSSRGGEWFVFPQDTLLMPGAALTVGTKDANLRWEEKRIVHKSKEDIFTLYDANGFAVSQITS